MTIKHRLPVADVILKHWNIIVKIDVFRKKTSHFIGLGTDDGLGHMSDEIIYFDEKSKFGLTTSGCVYEMVEEPGLPDTKALALIEEIIGLRRMFTLVRFGGEVELSFRYPIS